MFAQPPAPSQRCHWQRVRRSAPCRSTCPRSTRSVSPDACRPGHRRRPRRSPGRRASTSASLPAGDRHPAGSLPAVRLAGGRPGERHRRPPPRRALRTYTRPSCSHAETLPARVARPRVLARQRRRRSACCVSCTSGALGAVERRLVAADERVDDRVEDPALVGVGRPAAPGCSRRGCSGGRSAAAGRCPSGGGTSRASRSSRTRPTSPASCGRSSRRRSARSRRRWPGAT